MNLLQLRLLAFGPFTGLTLDLSRVPALHLIYGSNEAGKSTTLRAITGLLYGIPASTLDAHLHRMPELRIGARLSDGNGATLDVVRRKGNKNTLLDADDHPIDEAKLQHLLAGVSESLFRTMFGLDHESLRAGGEALLRGQGDVGESLFDAGVGGPGIHHVLEELRHDAEALFKPQGQNPRLNQAIALFREADKRSRERAVAAEAWLTQRQEIESARGEREELQQRRRALAAEQTRLQRALRVLPLLGKRRLLLTERAVLGDVVPLAADAAARRVAAQREAESSALQLQRLHEALGELQQRRAGLAVPPALVELDDAVVDDLQKRVGVHRSAAADLPKRRAELQAIEAEMRSLLRDLGRDTPLEAVESLRLPAAAQSRLRALAKRQGALEKELELATHAREDRRSRLEAHRTRLAGSGANGATRLPAPEAVDRFAAELQTLEREEGELRLRERELHQRAAKVSSAVEELRLLGDVPTEEQLRLARERRQALWDELVSRLDRPAAARLAADAYAASARAADAVADRLRREAERSGRLANLLAGRHEVEEQLRFLEGERGDLARRRASQAAAWTDLWQPSGVTPRPPAEMRAWLGERLRLEDTGVELDHEVAALEEKRRRADEQLAAWRAQWTTSVAEIGLEPDASVEEAEAVLEKLSVLQTRVEEANRLRARVAGMERDGERLRLDVDALVARHAPDLAGRPLEEAADTLVRRQREARDKNERRLEIDADIENKAAEEARLSELRHRAEDTLLLLQRAAGADSLAALEEAEKRWQQADQIARDLQQVEAELLDAGDGAKIEALVGLTAHVDPDGARVRLREIETDIEQVTDDLSRLDQKIGGWENGLTLFAGRTEAVEAAAEAQEHAAAIHTNVQRYLRARLAVLILEEEIERYRQSNQGPILQRANELFPRLTLGNYRTLKVGFDEHDDGVLLCVREDGGEVAVEGLSDGTRDQLYLALRLASLERYLRNNPGMPVILDDILIHFDDDRARAALSVLGEFATKAQVLFFTHHARLVELAREAVSDLVEHQLTSG